MAGRGSNRRSSHREKLMTDVKYYTFNNLVCRHNVMSWCLVAICDSWGVIIPVSRGADIALHHWIEAVFCQVSHKLIIFSLTVPCNALYSAHNAF